jgi:hypothetical protein
LGDGAESTAPNSKEISKASTINGILLSDLSSYRHGTAERTAAHLIIWLKNYRDDHQDMFLLFCRFYSVSCDLTHETEQNDK